MKHSQENFLDLVKEAYRGELQLPAFQREWKWERSRVISLYDSLRKRFPIGSFLFLETSSDYDLSPRIYEGVPEIAEAIPIKRLTRWTTTHNIWDSSHAWSQWSPAILS
ncbi:DUF262 domain-containing protein [Chloroflexota bacterium]